MRKQNLFDGVDVFELEINGVTYTIEEPEQFNTAEITNNRDDEFWGFNYEFFDEESAKLEWDKDSGYDLLKDQFEKYGTDATAIFRYYYLLSSGDKAIQLEGNLNFNTYENNFTTISCIVEKVSFENLYRTRFDTLTDLTKTETIDGKASSQLNPLTIKVHSKELTKITKTETTEAQFASAYKQPNHAAFIDDTSEVKVGEILGAQGTGFGISAFSPPFVGLYQFKFEEAGVYNIKFNARFDYYVATSYEVFGEKIYAIKNWNFKSLMIVLRNGHYILNKIGSESSGFTNAARIYGHIEDSYDEKINIEVGDQLYFYTQFIGSKDKEHDYELSNHYAKLDIIAQTVQPATDVKVYRLFDAITKAVELTTNKPNSVRSDFLGPGGCGYKYIIINGYQLRNFKVTEKPVQVALKTLISSSNAIWALGLSFEKENGEDIIRIEPVEYFFQEKKIARINSVYEYKERAASDLLFNEFEIGYNKFPDNDNGNDFTMLDEYDTIHNYLTTIKTYKKKLSKKSDFTSSGYAIEVQRREQFSQNPSDSLGADDDIFILTLDPTGTKTETTEAFETITDVISPDTIHNARITPKRMLTNWAPYINSICAFSSKSEKIKNTFVKNNGNFATKFKDSEPCKLKDPGGLVREKDDIRIADLWEGKKLFMPIWSEFKADLSYDEVLYIIAALKNQSPDDNNRGYIEYLNDEGLIVEGFPYKIKYNPITEQCTILAIRRYSDTFNCPDCDDACSDYRNWTFDDFERTLVPDSIEECIFDNFN